MQNQLRMPGTSHMRVVMMSDALIDRYGTGTYYRDLAENLETYIDHIELFCPRGKNSEISERILFPVPGDPTQNVVLPNLRQIGQKIRAIRPHTIIIATPGPYGFIGMFWARRLGIPLIVVYQTEFDKLTKMYWNPLLYGPSKLYLDSAYKLFFHVGLAAIVPNSALKNRIQNMGAPNVEVMGTFIARDFLAKPVSPLPKEMTSVLYSGRLAQEKNLEAILTCAEYFSDLNFVIAGHGPLTDKVIAYADTLQNLEYLGWVSRDTVLSLLDQSDMLVLPSKVEAFGTVALEGMARGRLVLVSPNCGIARDSLLRKGLLVMHRGEHLRGAIQRIQSLHHSVREKKASVARKTAQAYNGKTVAQWLELMSRSLRSNRG